MSRADTSRTAHYAPFAGRQRKFQLRIGEIGELERLCNAGIGEIMLRLAAHRYIAGDRCDYVGARHTVNGTDSAAEIAANAVKFEAAIVAGGASTIIMPAEPPPASNDNTKSTTKPASSGLFAAASAAIGAMLKRG